MNYLAHLLLSNHTADSLTGNLMGDFMHGLDRSKLPLSVELGVKNHIEVDRFTDSHTGVIGLRDLFSSKFRRFAPIILDITFDYTLSNNWSEFTEIDRTEFIFTAEQALLSRKDVMPQYMKNMVNILVEHQIFDSYKSLKGLENALDRTAERVRTFYHSIEEVVPNLSRIEDTFVPFFKELQNYVDDSAIEKGLV